MSTAKLITALAGLAIVILGIFYAVRWNQASGLTSSFQVATAIGPLVAVPSTAAPAAASPGTSVTLSGTLSYMQQQGKVVPYLLYTTDRGAAASKALAFRAASICVTAVEAPCPGDLHTLVDAYGNGRVTVSGTVEAESILVDRIQGG